MLRESALMMDIVPRHYCMAGIYTLLKEDEDCVRMAQRLPLED